jgi:hypothetical protein
MRQVKVKVRGLSPLGFSKHYEVPKLEKESPDAYELRTWRNRLHTDKEGQVVISAMHWKNMLRDVGKFLGEKVPGKKGGTFTKHFLSGILVVDPSPLGIAAADVPFERIFVPADGVTGSGKRVWKNFPVIHDWATEVVIYILDDTITQSVFERHMVQAGQFIGIGFFRPARGGNKGRFEVLEFKWNK